MPVDATLAMPHRAKSKCHRETARKKAATSATLTPNRLRASRYIAGTESRASSAVATRICVTPTPKSLKKAATYWK